MRKVLAVFPLLLMSVIARGQTVTPVINPQVQYVDASGAPCVGCKLHSYIAGSTTALPTFTDSTGMSQNQNPTTLDTSGSAQVWLGRSAYKLILKDANDATVIWTVDNINAGSISFISATYTGLQTMAGPLQLPDLISEKTPCYDVRAYASLSAALSAAGASSPNGANVCLPSTYSTTLTTGLVVTANTRILCSPGATITDGITTANGYMLTFSNGTNQGIEGCKIIGNLTTQQKGLILTSGTTSASIKNNTITNASYYAFVTGVNTNGLAAFQSENDTNLEITGNNCPTCFVQMWGGTSLGLNIHDNPALGGFFVQPIDETKPGTVTFSVKHNVFTPVIQLWRTPTCGGGGDFTTGSVAPLINWSITDNVCIISGSDSSHHAFGGWSIVKENTQNGTFANNQTYAISQYMDLGGLEFGGINSTITNNQFFLTDAHTQGYNGIESYAYGNTISNNIVSGWGQTGGSGIRVFALNGASAAKQNVIQGNNLTLSNASGSSAEGIGVICNYNGNSALDNSIIGNTVSITGGSSTMGIDLQDSSAGTLCPYSATVTGNTIVGGTYGIRPNNGTVYLGANTFDGSTPVHTAGSPTINPLYMYSASIANNLALAGGTAMTGNQGNGLLLQHSTGSTTTDHYAKFDANGNVVDAGVPFARTCSGTAPNESCYETLPDGTIHEFGTIQSGTLDTGWRATVSLTFPLAFPTAIHSVLCNPGSPGGSGDARNPVVCQTNSASTSSVTLNTACVTEIGGGGCSATKENVTLNWDAWGH